MLTNLTFKNSVIWGWNKPGFKDIFITLAFCSLVTAETAIAAEKPAAQQKNNSKPALHKQSSAGTKSIHAKTTEDVVVSGSAQTGGGMMRVETQPRTVQSVTEKYIAIKNPAGTALDMVKNLPSLNISAQDSSGMKGGAIESRSLTDADMSLLVDGGNVVTGMGHIQSTILSEDIESITVTPGASSIKLPTTTAAVGVMEINSHTPHDHAGGMTDFSYGTNNLSREFIRLETGKIGNSGIKGYVSFAHAHANTWMGAGRDDTKHIDLGVRKDFDNGSNIKIFTAWHNQDYTNQNFPTESQFLDKKHGRATYAWSDDRNSARYWGRHRNLWNVFQVTAPIHLVLNKKLSFDLHPYYAWSGGWSAASTNSFNTSGVTYASGEAVPAGTPTLNNYVSSEPMLGVTASLDYQFDAHNKTTIGYWYNWVNTYTRSVYSGVGGDGVAVNPANSSVAYYRSGQKYYSNNTDAGDEIHSIFLEHTSKYFKDNLVANAGIKVLMMNYWLKNNASQSSLQANTFTPLPHLSVGYSFANHHQVYINAEGDFRQPDPSTLSQISSIPRNQYSIKEELGYRYHDNHIVVDLSLFNYSITNRLLTAYNAQTTSYTTMNAGNQTARGFDLMVSARPIHHFSPYASFEYLVAHQDSNLPYAGSYLPTKGKEAIMSPHVMANLGLTYDDAHFFANVSLHYTGSQSVTLVGDQRMPGYITDSVALGYRFKSFGFLKSPTFRMNFSNITGSFVRTGTTGVANFAHNTILLNGQSTGAGSGAQFYLEPRFNMTGTISTEF